MLAARALRPHGRQQRAGLVGAGDGAAVNGLGGVGGFPPELG
jgi:hypothetical protein